MVVNKSRGLLGRFCSFLEASRWSLAGAPDVPKACTAHAPRQERPQRTLDSHRHTDTQTRPHQINENDRDGACDRGLC